MTRRNPIISDVIYGSYGAHLLDNLPALGEYGRNMLQKSWEPLHSCGGFGTLNAEMSGGVCYGKLEKSVQALDFGAGAGIF